MRRVELGSLAVTIDGPARGELADFLDHICGEDQTPTGTVANRPAYAVVVRCADRAALLLDPQQGKVTLTVPAGADATVTQIGVLQALTRGVAHLERSSRRLTLLHGSALTVNGAGVAVLDGGLGQGKTSLALGLAGRHGRLLVDEFAFARIDAGGVELAAAPTLPWHVRTDMAPYLVPRAAGAGPLRYPDDLAPIAKTASGPAPLRLVLIPDHTTRPGQIRAVPAQQVPRLLACSVTDHARKLAEPRLDHVSIFDSADQVRDGAGRRLLDQAAAPARTAADTGRVLARLGAVPVYRVGIGTPGDLPASVTAATRLVAAAVAG